MPMKIYFFDASYNVQNGGYLSGRLSLDTATNLEGIEIIPKCNFPSEGRTAQAG